MPGQHLVESTARGANGSRYSWWWYTNAFIVRFSIRLQGHADTSRVSPMHRRWNSTGELLWPNCSYLFQLGDFLWTSGSVGLHIWWIKSWGLGERRGMGVLGSSKVEREEHARGAQVWNFSPRGGLRYILHYSPVFQHWSAEDVLKSFFPKGTWERKESKPDLFHSLLVLLWPEPLPLPFLS